MDKTCTTTTTGLNTLGMTAAPEVLKGAAEHGPPVDFWSLGCMLYVMMYGRYPFLAEEDLRSNSNEFTRTFQRAELTSRSLEKPDTYLCSAAASQDVPPKSTRNCPHWPILQSRGMLRMFSISSWTSHATQASRPNTS